MKNRRWLAVVVAGLLGTRNDPALVSGVLREYTQNLATAMMRYFSLLSAAC